MSLTPSSQRIARLLALCATALGSTHATPAVGDDQCSLLFNGQRTRWVVPYAVGGAYDTYSRLLQPFVEEALGTRVTVENIPGAGGITGARFIREATPDGKTLGVVNDTGLMLASLGKIRDVPDPAEDFTILGRIAPAKQIWATGIDSKFRSVEDIINYNQTEDLVFGIRDVGGNAFINVVVTAQLLGVEPNIVAGFSGTPHIALAASRGDVDLISGNFESLLKWVVGGELRPLLQISAEEISAHESLKTIPLLGGPEGWAESRAAELGWSLDTARSSVHALSTLIGGGRLIIAPRGIDGRIRRCLQHAIFAALTDPRFREIARTAQLSVEPSRASDAESEVLLALNALKRFEPSITTSYKEWEQRIFR